MRPRCRTQGGDSCSCRVTNRFDAALLLAVTPGPGIFYVAARTLAGGRAEGVASSLGTGLGGMVHVLAGSLGVSAIVLASAELFTALKLIGAAYLVWLGLRTDRAARRDALAAVAGRGRGAARSGTRRAFREGVLVEALNPKTAAFFLAFVPQFVDPAAGRVAPQFVLLGFVSVAAQHPRRRGGGLRGGRRPRRRVAVHQVVRPARAHQRVVAGHGVVGGMT